METHTCSIILKSMQWTSDLSRCWFQRTPYLDTQKVGPGRLCSGYKRRKICLNFTIEVIIYMVWGKSFRWFRKSSPRKRGTFWWHVSDFCSDSSEVQFSSRKILLNSSGCAWVNAWSRFANISGLMFVGLLISPRSDWLMKSAERLIDSTWYAVGFDQ